MEHIHKQESKHPDTGSPQTPHSILNGPTDAHKIRNNTTEEMGKNKHWKKAHTN